jgi:hypothetical protein
VEIRLRKISQAILVRGFKTVCRSMESRMDVGKAVHMARRVMGGIS